MSRVGTGGAVTWRHRACRYDNPSPHGNGRRPECDDGPVRTVKFRYHVALPVAGALAFIGTVPVAATSWWLAPLLVPSILVVAWGARAGTDADRAGVRVRALVASRRIAWDRIAQFAPDPRGRVHAILVDGSSVRLIAVDKAELPRLVAASGEDLAPAAAGPDPGPDAAPGDQ